MTDKVQVSRLPKMTEKEWKDLNFRVKLFCLVIRDEIENNDDEEVKNNESKI